MHCEYASATSVKSDPDETFEVVSDSQLPAALHAGSSCDSATAEDYAG